MNTIRPNIRRYDPWVPPSKRVSSRVLLDFGSWEITLREAIFSLFIVGVMTLGGFLISNKIEEVANKKTLVYRSAVDLNNDSEFEHGIRTGIGHSFSHGKLVALEPKTYNGIKGKFLRVGIDHQKYQMHTQVYTTVDSKGRTHIRTRHYWEWDTISHDELNPTNVMYCGVKIPYSKFNLDDVSWSLMSSQTIPTGHNKRDIVTTIPSEFHVSMFANLKDGTISGDGVLSLASKERMRETLVKNHNNVLFWVGWVLLTMVVVGVFFVFENYWLEDKEGMN